ncbi:MAG: adenylate/guanylate cyclase domain-containing protein [Candidatus Aminicenantaceae bacterium]|jgi:adenylate cyclase
MPLLHITCRDGKVFDFPLNKDKVVIGRNEDNDIVLPDPLASRHHVQIKKEKKGYVLKDLGSHNGTKVNGKLIQEVRLKEQDKIQIGQCELVFLIEEDATVSKSDTFVLASENDQDDWQQQTIRINPQKSCLQDSEELLATIVPGKQQEILARSVPSFQKKETVDAGADVLTLERMNKVLFVLYEVSRQLNSSLDFNELLNKIMDLLFMVIDAGYGSLILLGEGKGDDLVPVVMKSRDDEMKGKSELKISRTIIDRVVKDKVALLTSDAMSDSRLADAASIVTKGIRSAMCVPLWDKDKIIGAIQLNSTRLDNLFTMDDLELLKTIGCQMAMIIGQARLNQQIQEEERMRIRLERFHSPQVIDMIIKGSHEDQDDLMEAKELTTTILFTDMVKFTTLSETMHPREINALLNQHFSRMTDIVFDYNGTLDKYLGDGIMAVFGAPMEKKDDAKRAVQAALEIRKDFLDMMEKSTSETKFEIRMGINTGRVVAGNIGSPRRLDYTVIGDPVNTASRLESIAKPNQILIGEETYKQIKGKKFKIKKIGPTKLKGKKEEILVYEVLD